MLLERVSSLEQLDRMKNDFVSMVSHELRTPLTSIIAETQFALRHGHQSDETRTTLERILPDDIRHRCHGAGAMVPYRPASP